ncbi:stearoyl-CoA desaturase (delta-9 desaturase) [Herbihabitans rhizosphaerae]|uniref:Stearoyl-CoA desaturase (Delta-9 desaturase) n=1 Tax=Herbihabitans rhizosphaerae TaxID=1872711 RepID=A0A4Q7KW45_9PSEU|nr:acyl-CoA desaturase [Herbihabitans rhizosphaerae]RZS40796.1 stearoyl-CoA desaturase (delta-9 desaturase) [Herbihabitans rhizosphaerae]
MTATVDRDTESKPKSGPSGPKSIMSGQRDMATHIAVYLFILVPFAALIAAVPLMWGWGLGWVDIGLAVFFFYFAGLGVTIGYHRLFTHGSFKANRPLKILLAVAGSAAVQGPPITWVADHRRHHAFSDREGDPHSPWLFGTSPWALTRGFWHAHMGWVFDKNMTNKQRFAPDLFQDKDIVRVNKLFPLITALSLVLPGILGGLITWSWAGALSAFFWAGLVRISVLHHVTWSTNSICHMVGERPFKSRDKAANFWPLAILSFGESWHNLHHADPTCARHGVKRGQIDTSARLIWIFEKFGWATDVRWPTPQRLARITAGTE